MKFKKWRITLLLIILGAGALISGCAAKSDGYRVIRVDGGDLNGTRAKNAKVDVGFGEREYWAYTNEYGQLVRVEAERITLQNDKTEPVLESGRYYPDEADVLGTEDPLYDKGHVIADSLGGVSNAYNITPENRVLNRSGDQAYMEKNIRDAGGCTNFRAEITYPNNETQIPSHYKITYVIEGRTIVDEFDNKDPEALNRKLFGDLEKNINAIDTNLNGIVSVAEAKAAGFKMPITKDHWLYKFMNDGDGDGKVGE